MATAGPKLSQSYIFIVKRRGDSRLSRSNGEGDSTGRVSCEHRESSVACAETVDRASAGRCRARVLHAGHVGSGDTASPVCHHRRGASTPLTGGGAAWALRLWGPPPPALTLVSPTSLRGLLVSALLLGEHLPALLLCLPERMGTKQRAVGVAGGKQVGCHCSPRPPQHHHVP